MSDRGDVYDPHGSLGFSHRRQEELGEQEMAHVVNTHLHLKAILRQRVGSGHYAGIVDEVVDGQFRLLHPVGECQDWFERGQIDESRNQLAPQ